MRDPLISKSKAPTFKAYEGNCLFRVHGVDPSAVRTVEVADEAASLCSGDVFILQTPGVVFVWQGGEVASPSRGQEPCSTVLLGCYMGPFFYHNPMGWEDDTKGWGGGSRE